MIDVFDDFDTQIQCEEFYDSPLTPCEEVEKLYFEFSTQPVTDAPLGALGDSFVKHVFSPLAVAQTKQVDWGDMEVRG